MRNLGTNERAYFVFHRLSGSHTDCNNDDCNNNPRSRNDADATTSGERTPAQNKFTERFIRYSLPDGYDVAADSRSNKSNSDSNRHIRFDIKK